MEPPGSAIVIDLGLERGEPRTYAAPTRSTVPAWFSAGVLVVLLLLCASGSAAPAAPPLRTVFRIPIESTDTYALTDSGQLVVQSDGQLGGYDLRTGRLRWLIGQPTPSYRLRSVDGLLLLRPYRPYPLIGGEPGTTAISTSTGVAQWKRPDNVVTLADTSTLLAVAGIRNLTGVGRRVRGPVGAVDPRTGDTRWTVDVPDSAILFSVPGPTTAGRLLVVRDDGTAHLHDLDTGRELGSTTLPAADYTPQNPAVVAGMIVLLYPGPAGTHLVAYDLATLTAAWTEYVDDAVTVQACGALACVTGPDGVRAIDPVSGAVRWVHADWHSVGPVGHEVVAYARPDQRDPIGLVDPASGTVLVRLAGWQPVGEPGADQLLMTRAIDAATRSMVAVARRGVPEPSPLAELPVGTGDCQAAPGWLVCRLMYGELIVWAYGSS